MTTRSMQQAALTYAKRFSFHVFPIYEVIGTNGSTDCACPRTHPSRDAQGRCGSPGKHPRTVDGFKSATLDPARIAEWWTRWPQANIGIATGASGLLVLDIDPRNGGDEALEALLAEQDDDFPATPTVQTGGGGEHYYFRAPAEQVTARPIAPGVDVKADGGYVVAAPSSHIAGRAYAWELTHHVRDLPIAETPEWIAERLRRPPMPATSNTTSSVESSFLFAAFNAADWVIRPLGLGKVAVRCPWDDEHTSGTAGDSSTVLFAARDGASLGWFHCSHEHCRSRPIEDVLAAIPAAATKIANAVMENGNRPARGSDEKTPDDGATVPADHAVDEDWPAPINLDALALPAVPLAALPAVLRAQVEDVARVVQVAPDLPAAIGLGVIAAGCARRVEVAIGRTHVEPANLYVAPVAASGERKGPTYRAMLAPVHALERERRQAAEPAIAMAAEARRLAEKRLEHLRNVAAKTNDPAERATAEADAKQLAVELPVVPPRPTLVVSDRTVEKLEQDLAEQDGALLLADEEAGTFVAIACGRYSRDGTSNLDVYLKGYDGGKIDTGRMSRAAVECSEPALSVVLTPQPIILQQLRERPELHHRGLLPRFAWIMVPSLVGARPYSDAPPRADVRVAYEKMVRRLFDLPKATGTTNPRQLVITGPTLGMWRAYADRIESEMATGGRLEPIREWASKHPGRVARIAGTFHMIEHGTTTGTISGDAISAACDIGAWLEAHALAAYDSMAADPRLGDARRLLAWLRREPMKHTFTERDAFRALGGDSMDAFRLVLGLLVETEHIRLQIIREPRSGPGRKPSPIYETNPATLKTPDTIDRIPPKTRPPTSSVNCVVDFTHPEPEMGAWGEV